ncbi:MAG: OBAP family protein [Oligoflexus sp.]
MIYAFSFRTFGLVCLISVQACAPRTQPLSEPLGEEKTTETKVLEAGAKLLQRTPPLSSIDIHLVGIHPMKDQPEHQMDTHHFCKQVNEDFTQCVLFDSDADDANMNGIEYIISEKLFASLPDEERQFWHPHNYEILSGILVAPGLPDAAEKRLMRNKVNSYGKTWHVWNTGTGGNAGDNLPLGEAMLGWSLNRDGEADPHLLEDRDEKLGVDMQSKRRQRQELIELTNPQEGVV